MSSGRKVSVYLRIKPPENLSDELCVKLRSPTSISITDTTVYSSPIEALYPCDGVIGPDETISEELFSSPSSATLYIGYGHSGSGKTHTMFGAGGVLNGIVDRFLASSCSIQFFQIYNEKISDLLTVGSTLTVRDDGYIPQLTTVGITSISELVSVVEIGLSNRIVSENAIHAHSSRSHAILRLFLPSNQIITIVDLAGSERTHVSYKQQRNRQTELQSIHKSLHALRHCIMELGSPRQDTFSNLPMRRTSVLTKILFSPNPPIDQCVLIACISPEKKFERETLSTLDFVSAGLNLNSWWRKKHVTHTDVSIAPIVVSGSEVDQLRQTVLNLQAELQMERERRVQLESRCDSPPPLADLSYRRQRKLTDETMTPIIVESTITPSLVDSPPVENMVPKNCLSQEWRHSQYDAILKKMWKSSPSHDTPKTRITTLIPLLPG